MNGRSFCSLALAWLFCAGTISQATPFSIENLSGTLSYSANVAHRLDNHSVLVTQTSGTSNGSTQAGGPANVTDFSRSSWQLGGNFDGTKTATTVTTLDKVYDLNRIDTQYLDYRPATYSLRTSVDNVNWTPLVTGAAPAFINNNTFATRQVKYIEWTSTGPGADLGFGFYMYMSQLRALVDSASLDVPQLEGGYNVLRSATTIAQSGDMGAISDENFTNFSIPGGGAGATRTYDLGTVTEIGTLKVDFYPGQQWTSGSVEFSTDNVSYTPVMSLGGINSTTFSVPNALRDTRYIRISGIGGGAMVEFGAFIPEPTAGLMLAVGGAAILISRRRTAGIPK